MTDNRPMAPIIISYELYIFLYEIVYISVGIALICKKKIVVMKGEEYLDNFENRKKLKDVLISNDMRYKGIIVFETIVLGFIANLFLRNGIRQILLFILQLFIVAIFQKNIYYLFLIRKIAKQYGISLKSKDVLAKNDAEREKQINEEKEIISQTDTEIKSEIDTGNKMNLEINTQISTENNKSNQNDENTDAKRKKDMDTESDITTDIPLNSTQKQDTHSDK